MPNDFIGAELGRGETASFSRSEHAPRQLSMKDNRFKLFISVSLAHVSLRGENIIDEDTIAITDRIHIEVNYAQILLPAHFNFGILLHASFYLADVPLYFLQCSASFRPSTFSILATMEKVTALKISSDACNVSIYIEQCISDI